MDNATRDLWQKIVNELKSLNSTLNKLLKITYGRGKKDQSVGTQESAVSCEGDLRNYGTRPLQKWENILRRWKPVVELAGIISAIAYAVITFNQWRDANSNFRAGQRAWVLVSSALIEKDLSVTEDIPVKFAIKNYGPSPGLDAITRTHFEFTGQCDVMTAVSPYQSLAPIGPGEEQREENKVIGKLDQVCLDALQSGTASAKIVGTISYDDIFDAPHTTEYCFVYEGRTTHQFSYCEKGNTAN